MNKNNLRKRFIEKINRDESKGVKTYNDSNAGFRRFLKDLGVEPFNYRRGSLVVKPKLAKRGY